SFYVCLHFFCLFFFQAGDGIRYGHVTGVQTCALPISSTLKTSSAGRSPEGASGRERGRTSRGRSRSPSRKRTAARRGRSRSRVRSEERRVGKEWESRLWG